MLTLGEVTSADSALLMVTSGIPSLWRGDYRAVVGRGPVSGPYSRPSLAGSGRRHVGAQGAVLGVLCHLRNRRHSTGARRGLGQSPSKNGQRLRERIRRQAGRCRARPAVRSPRIVPAVLCGPLFEYPARYCSIVRWCICAEFVLGEARRTIDLRAVGRRFGRLHLLWKITRDYDALLCGADERKACWQRLALFNRALPIWPRCAKPKYKISRWLFARPAMRRAPKPYSASWTG